MSTKTVNSVIHKGKTYQYVDNGEPMRGGMKDVYFSPDKSYVVGFYRKKLDYNSMERLRLIVTQYKDSIFNRIGGDYWKNLYCWPYDVVKEGDLTGIVVPTYNKRFFFKQGYANDNALKGKEKDGKWFASAKFRTNNPRTKLHHSELGNWLSYVQVCVYIARGVKRLHAAGLAHSDLSYKNVLIDPTNGASANIIDIDGLVVPGKFPPDVIGTADFIAPEVLATKHLKSDDPNRKLPNRLTDLHALAVLIYMYLLYRHPLRGGKFFGPIDETEEENLMMGKEALFIEHPADDSYRNFKREYGHNLKKFYPWTNLSQTPYHITGPYLKPLFDQAFITGLHQAQKRPPADTWEQALIKTDDLKLQCSSKNCEEQWFIYNNQKNVYCPFCKTPYKTPIPVLDFYYKFRGKWKPNNQRLVVYHNSTLHQWHVNNNVVRNEKLSIAKTKRVGYFSYHQNKWYLVNEDLTTLKDIKENKQIAIGGLVELKNGKQLLLSTEEGGKVVHISLANN